MTPTTAVTTTTTTTTTTTNTLRRSFKDRPARSPRPPINQDKPLYIVHPDLPKEKLFNDRGDYQVMVLRVQAYSVGEALQKALQRGYIHSPNVVQYFKAVPGISAA